jgi:phosphoribosylglycinamide formyltransferase-1
LTARHNFAVILQQFQALYLAVYRARSVFSAATNDLTRPKRIAILASGQGSNLANIHDQIVQKRLRSAEVVLVISNNSTSGAMQLAKERGIPSLHLSLLRCQGDESVFCDTLASTLDEYQVDLIVLAGYMKMLPERIVEMYEDRILNVHPSLLPAFGGNAMYGLKVHEAVIEHGCKVTGATVHFVTSEYDEGPIVAQRCCAVRAEDTPETLQQRVGEIERELLPMVIDLVARGSVKVVGRKVFVESGIA